LKNAVIHFDAIENELKGGHGLKREVAEAFAVLATNLEMWKSRFKGCCKALQTVDGLQQLCY
jgi:hypothetical protein